MTGSVALFGSGEAAPSGRRVHEWLFRRLESPIRIAILETPAGFELNSAQVAGRIGDFLDERLQNYHPQVDIIPARKKNTPHSPDDGTIAAPILKANYIFMGPGSPTYAVRQLANSLAWHYVIARHRLGATLALASAAAIAISAQTLPVYEIYKVGEDLHWKPGLDLFAPYGLKLVFISHWNNTQGGNELDTSCCWMGRSRMEALLQMLPPDLTVVGVDEHTAFILELEAERCRIMGKGSVTTIRNGEEHAFLAGEQFPIDTLGGFRIPSSGEGIPDEVWARALEAQTEEQLPPEIAALIEERETARQRKDWAHSDAIREQLAELGYHVQDTPQGARWERIED